MIDPIPRSRYRIHPFVLHRAGSYGEALDLFAHLDGDAAFMGGGIELLNRMKSGLAVGNVILLRDIAGNSTIRRNDGFCEIGAGCSVQSLADDPHLREAQPGLARALGSIANSRIRRQATVGGNIMAGEAHYEVLPCLLALGAVLEFETVTGHVPLELGDESRAMARFPDNAVLSGVRLKPDWRIVGYCRDFAPLFTVALAREACGDNWRVALGGAHERPVASAFKIVGDARETAAACCASLPPMRDTFDASSGYRRQVVPVVLRRMLTTILESGSLT